MLVLIGCGSKRLNEFFLPFSRIQLLAKPFLSAFCLHSGSVYRPLSVNSLLFNSMISLFTVPILPDSTQSSDHDIFISVCV